MFEVCRTLTCVKNPILPDNPVSFVLHLRWHMYVRCPTNPQRGAAIIITGNEFPSFGESRTRIHMTPSSGRETTRWTWGQLRQSRLLASMWACACFRVRFWLVDHISTHIQYVRNGKFKFSCIRVRAFYKMCWPLRSKVWGFEFSPLRDFCLHAFLAPQQHEGKEGSDESLRARDERKCCLGRDRKRKSDSKVNRKHQSVEC